MQYLLLISVCLTFGFLVGWYSRYRFTLKAFERFNRHLDKLEPDYSFNMKRSYDMGTGIYNELCIKKYPDLEFVQLYWRNTNNQQNHPYSFDIPCNHDSEESVNLALNQVLRCIVELKK